VPAFVEEVVRSECYVVCNSVGGLAGLQLAKIRPDLVRGLVLLNISLRMLHIKKQPWYLKPFVKALQNTLRESKLGAAFFAQVRGGG
jgi:pimeloyl-ACP methyl ester carboxylesterase